jgi:hypothetical protein
VLVGVALDEDDAALHRDEVAGIALVQARNHVTAQVHQVGGLATVLFGERLGQLAALSVALVDELLPKVHRSVLLVSVVELRGLALDVGRVAHGRPLADSQSSGGPSSYSFPSRSKGMTGPPLGAFQSPEAGWWVAELRDLAASPPYPARADLP